MRPGGGARRGTRARPGYACATGTVQLKRLARELQPQAYARRKLKLRDLKYAQRVAAALAAARSLFPSHADLLVAAGAQRPDFCGRGTARAGCRCGPAAAPFAALFERLGV
jgi:hypothetical protein